MQRSGAHHRIKVELFVLLQKKSDGAREKNAAFLTVTTGVF